MADETLTVVEVLFSPFAMAAVPVVFWLRVGNVQLVRLPDAGVPRFGVMSVAEVVRTTLPEPELAIAETEVPLP